MVLIVQVDRRDEKWTDYLKCPQCNARLCNKSKTTKVKELSPEEIEFLNRPTTQLVIQCHRCKSRFLLFVEDKIE